MSAPSPHPPSGEHKGTAAATDGWVSRNGSLSQGGVPGGVTVSEPAAKPTERAVEGGPLSSRLINAIVPAILRKLTRDT